MPVHAGTSASRSRDEATAASKETGKKRALAESNVQVTVVRPNKAAKTAKSDRSSSSSAAAALDVSDSEAFDSSRRRGSDASVGSNASFTSASSSGASSSSSSSRSRSSSGSNSSTSAAAAASAASSIFQITATADEKIRIHGQARKDVREALRDKKWQGVDGMKNYLTMLQERHLWLEKIINEQQGDNPNVQLAATVAEQKEQVEALSTQLSKAHSDLADALRAKEAKEAQLSTLTAAKRDVESRHAKEVEALKAEHATALQAAKARAGNDREAAIEDAIANAKAGAEREKKAAIAKANAKYEEEMDGLRQAHEAAVAKLTRGHKAAVDALQDQVDAQTKEVGALRAQLAVAQAKAEELGDRLKAEVAARDDAMAAKASAEAALVEYKRRFESADAKRVRLLEEVINLKGAIRVFVRVRPLAEGEAGPDDIKYGSLYAFHKANGESSELELVEKPGAGIGGYGESKERKRHGFNFQKVFAPNTSQEGVFEEVETLVSAALEGHRVCIFAYGQTGSGKTYTMMGAPNASSSSSSSADADTRGIIPRSVELIVDRLATMRERGWEAGLSVEMLEIYNEELRDLLPMSGGGGGGGGGKKASSASSSSSSSAASSSSSKELEIRHEGKDTCVAGLSVHKVESAEQLARLLEKANAARATGATNSNSASSRSHCVFTLRVSLSNPSTAQNRKGVLNLIDLAGSERIAKSGVNDAKAGGSAALLKETQNINSSLSALAKVIMALQQKATHVPFRDSKLTFLLQNSLGNGAKTVLLANLNPTFASTHESLCTLRFAQSVAQTINKMKE